MGETLTPQTEWQIEETDMPSGGIRYEEEFAINNEGCESDDSEREGAASFRHRARPISEYGLMFG